MIRRILALVAAALAVVAAPAVWVFRAGRWIPELGRPAPQRSPAAALAEGYVDEMERPTKDHRPPWLADPDGLGMLTFQWAVAVKNDQPVPRIDGIARNVQLWLGALTRQECAILASRMPVTIERHIAAERGIVDRIPGVPRVPSLAEIEAIARRGDASGKGGGGKKPHADPEYDGVQETLRELLAYSAVPRPR